MIPRVKKGEKPAPRFKKNRTHKVEQPKAPVLTKEQLKDFKEKVAPRLIQNELVNPDKAFVDYIMDNAVDGKFAGLSVEKAIKLYAGDEVPSKSFEASYYTFEPEIKIIENPIPISYDESKLHKAITALQDYEKKRTINDPLASSGYVYMHFLTDPNGHPRTYKPEFIELEKQLYETVPQFMIIVLHDEQVAAYTDKLTKTPYITSEIVTFKSIVKNYKQREDVVSYSQRKKLLLQSYDAFVCDKSIHENLTKFFGKTFEKKNKSPIATTVDTLVEDLDKITKSTKLRLREGETVATVRVGLPHWETKELMDNAKTILQNITKYIRTDTIRQISIKMPYTPILPFYEMSEKPKKTFKKEEERKRQEEAKKKKETKQKKVIKEKTKKVHRKRKIQSAQQSAQKKQKK